MRQAIIGQKKKANLGLFFFWRIGKIKGDISCGYRIAALPDPSKIVRGVRLPLPAPKGYLIRETRVYFAYSTILVSLITFTFIWPG